MSENAVPWELGPNTIDFTRVTVIGLPASGIISINGDTTPAQLLTKDPSDPQIQITDLGLGDHRFEFKGAVVETGTGIGPFIPVPVGIETTLLSIVIPAPGWWLPYAYVNSETALPGNVLVTLSFKNGLSILSRTTKFVTVGATIDNYSETCNAVMVPLNGGETIDLTLTQDSIGPFSVGATLGFVRIGSL